MAPAPRFVGHILPSLRARDRRRATVEDCPVSGPAPPERARIARRELLGQISIFLLKYDLEVTCENLDFAFTVITGNDARLAARFADRVKLHQPITQEWINLVRNADNQASEIRRETDTLMDQAEQMIDIFGKTVKKASGETEASCIEVDRQIALAKRQDSGSETQQALELSQAMLKSLRRIAAAMLESQSECEMLRKSLAEARLAADRDHLTGLPNRRAFEREFERQRKLGEGKARQMGVAFCDVDHFKRINDTFGHETGDRLLMVIADLLKEHASQHCFVARHGGEEFAILFADLSLEEATERLETVRLKLQRRKFFARKSDRPVGRVTLSAGIADATRFGSLSAALASADEALYQAKQTGRNKVVVASTA